MRYLKNTQGSALVIMLFSVTIVSLLGMTLISTSLRENKISHYQQDSITAQYLAEGGLQKVIVSLKKHPNWKSDTYWDNILGRDIPSGSGTYTLTFNEKSNNLLEVISTGKSRSGQKVLKADIKITKINRTFENLVSLNSQSAINLYGNTDIFGDIYSNTDLTFIGNNHVRGNITCLGKTTIYGNQTIDGQLYSGGDILISGNSNIKGNILGLSNLTINGNPNIKGTIQINGEVSPKGIYDIIYGGVGHREPIVFPKLNEGLIEFYRQDAMDQGTYYESGNFPMNISGITFIDNDVNLWGNNKLRGHGILFVNGDLNLGGNTQIISNKDGAIVIIVNGNIEVNGNQDLKCVFYSTGNFKIWGNTTIYGSIVSKNIGGTGNLDVRTLDNLQDRLPHDAPGIFETKVELEALTYD